MLKIHLFILWNTTRAILRKQDEPYSFHQYNWVKPITRLFYLQINVLKFILEKLWDGFNNCSTNDWYTGRLKQKNSVKDMKNFHICDDFFQLLVEAFIITFTMNTSSCKTINSFCTWLSKLDWPDHINKMESLGSLYIVSDICGGSFILFANTGQSLSFCLPIRLIHLICLYWSIFFILLKRLTNVFNRWA